MVRPLGKYRDKNILFEPKESAYVLAVPHEMKQVSLNLLTNALDSIEVGGTVVLSLVQEKGVAVFKVQDNGCGMTEEVLKHLFEPFFTRKQNRQGTGLGLSITYSIIHEHGGTIEVYSEGVGCGATFTLKLPLCPADARPIYHHQQVA